MRFRPSIKIKGGSPIINVARSGPLPQDLRARSPALRPASRAVPTPQRSGSRSLGQCNPIPSHRPIRPFSLAARTGFGAWLIFREENEMRTIPKAGLFLGLWLTGAGASLATTRFVNVLELGLVRNSRKVMA